MYKLIFFLISILLIISCSNTETIKGPFIVQKIEKHTDLEKDNYSNHLDSINFELLESYFTQVNQSINFENLKLADSILQTDSYLSSLNRRELSKFYFDKTLKKHNLLMTDYVVSEDKNAVVFTSKKDSLINWDSILRIKVEKYFPIQNLATAVYTFIKVKR